MSKFQYVFFKHIVIILINTGMRLKDCTPDHTQIVEIPVEGIAA